MDRHTAETLELLNEKIPIAQLIRYPNTRLCEHTGVHWKSGLEHCRV